MSIIPAVSNASPLIVFHQIESLELVRAILGEVLIPPAVADEVAPSLGDLPSWVRVSELPTIQGSFPWWSSLDRGEVEAIALAMEVSAGQILLDDRPARHMAKRLGLSVVGSLGLLLDAQRLGLIDDVRPYLDAMIDVGFHVGHPLYGEVLGLAEELDQVTRGCQ